MICGLANGFRRTLYGLRSGRQDGVVGIGDEDGKQLRRFGLAGIGADVVAISRQLGEVLAAVKVLVYATVQGALWIAPSMTVA